MSGIGDLIDGQVVSIGAQTPTLMHGTVLDASPLRVQVPDLDGGDTARDAFGYLPDATPGDQVRVMLDRYGSVVVVAWQPQDPDALD